VTIEDWFSRYCWLYPLQTKEASKVTEHLFQVFEEYGTPTILHTDNGGEFISTEGTKHFESAGIKVVHGMPHNPRVQGLIERFNQTFEKEAGKKIDS